MKFPECIFIERTAIQYTVRKKSGDVGYTATVVQFPVRLAFAITAHKVQGQSILHPTTVAMDLESVFAAAQAYVMLSRVQSIDQLYIVRSLAEDKIRTSSLALKELQRLEEISYNRNKSPWIENGNGFLKIATLNIAGLLPHHRDLVKDTKIQHGHIIQLLETSLPADCDTSDITIEGYRGEFLNIGNGKGMAMFLKDVPDCCLIFREEQTLQISKLELEDIDIISVYR